MLSKLTLFRHVRVRVDIIITNKVIVHSKISIVMTIIIVIIIVIVCAKVMEWNITSTRYS